MSTRVDISSPRSRDLQSTDNHSNVNSFPDDLEVGGEQVDIARIERVYRSVCVLIARRVTSDPLSIESLIAASFLVCIPADMRNSDAQLLQRSGSSTSSVQPSDPMLDSLRP